MVNGTARHRVLHLVHSQQRRGAEVFAAQLAFSLEQGGQFENGVCSLYNTGGGLPVNGLPVLPVAAGESPLDRKLGLDPWTLSRMCRVLRRFRPDIILAHGSSTLKYAALAGVLYRRPATIYRNIGTASFWASSPARVNFNRLLLRWVDGVVSVSQYTREDFIKVYRLPPERVTFIPNGVDASEFDGCQQRPAREEARRELGLSPTDVAFIAVGNLSHEKGHQGLLNLMRDLRARGLDSHLALVGEGPLRQKLEEQARDLGISNRVHFLGRRSDVPRLLAAADLFVLSSKTEGMPGVLIEAGLAGLAAVSFDVGGVSEVVEDQETGLLVPPGDFQEMARALLALSQDPQRRTRMGEAARQRCRELFDIRTVASSYEEFFMRVLSKNAKGSSRRGEWPTARK